MRMDAGKELLELVEALLRIVRIIGADVEIIFDGVRTASETFEQIRVICGLTDIRIISCRRLLQDTC